MTLGTEAAVVLFARAPALERTGRNTSAIHLALLLRALNLAAQSSADEVVLSHFGVLPDAVFRRVDALRAAGRRVSCVAQVGTGFQERVLGSLRQVAQRVGRVVAVAVDTPSLSLGDLEVAVRAERSVMGPARDGGFYLLGFESSVLAQLEGLDWCAARLGDVVVASLGDVVFLKTRRDVDTVLDVLVQATDLARLVRRVLGAVVVAGVVEVEWHRPLCISWRVWGVRGPPCRSVLAG